MDEKAFILWLSNYKGPTFKCLKLYIWWSYCIPRFDEPSYMVSDFQMDVVHSGGESFWACPLSDLPNFWQFWPWKGGTFAFSAGEFMVQHWHCCLSLIGSLQSAVMVSCKMPVDAMTTVKDYRDSLAEAMFHCALNQRFFKISRRKDPPYFSCSSAAEVLVRPVKAYIMTSTCKERGTIEALESMLLEVISWQLGSWNGILFSSPIFLVVFFFLGCSGTASWIFRTWNRYCPCFNDVRNRICLFGAWSDAINNPPRRISAGMSIMLNSFAVLFVYVYMISTVFFIPGLKIPFFYFIFIFKSWS